MAFIMNLVEEEPSRGPPPRPVLVIASSAMKNVNSFDDWIKILDQSESFKLLIDLEHYQVLD